MKHSVFKVDLQASYVFTKLSFHSCNLWLLKLSNKFQMLLFLFRCIHIVTFCPTYIRYMNQGVYIYIVTFCPTYIHVKQKYKLWLFVLWLFVLWLFVLGVLWLFALWLFVLWLSVRLPLGLLYIVCYLYLFNQTIWVEFVLAWKQIKSSSHQWKTTGSTFIMGFHCGISTISNQQYYSQTGSLLSHFLSHFFLVLSYELNLFKEVTCLKWPHFLCPKGDLLIQVLSVFVWIKKII